MKCNNEVIPKGDITGSTLIAGGAPTQQAVTSTDSGGKNGWIAVDKCGNNLQAQVNKTQWHLKEVNLKKRHLFGLSISPVYK